MKVTLLTHTADPERTIAGAARLCYSGTSAEDTMKNITADTICKVLKTILDSGHYSALEMADYIFTVDGMARIISQQLTRHRHASFNQQSQRYVRLKDPTIFVVPPSIEELPEKKAKFLDACLAGYNCYIDLLEADVPAEDARFVLPNATETTLVFKMNARELLHFFTLRCCKRAQWQIRELADAMLELVEPTAPYIFQDAGAACRRGACREGKMTCGSPYPRANRRD